MGPGLSDHVCIATYRLETNHNGLCHYHKWEKTSTTTKTERHNCWGQSSGWIQSFSRTLTGILFYQRNPFFPRMTLTLLYVREIDWSRCVTYCQLFDLKRVKSCWANNHLQKRTIKPATPYLSLHSLSAYNIARSRNCQLTFPISQLAEYNFCHFCQPKQDSFILSAVYETLWTRQRGKVLRSAHDCETGLLRFNNLASNFMRQKLRDASHFVGLALFYIKILKTLS